MYFFTADEHYNHANIIRYSKRPFSTIEEMNDTMIEKFNEKVTSKDITIHAGDFCFGRTQDAQNIIRQLNGNHIFLKGSHDRWLKNKKATPQIWEKRIHGQLIVVCHYCLRTWAASHYNSWHLYGHSHGCLPSEGKSHDIGVDTNDFYPYSEEDILEIMYYKPDNFNLVKDRKY